MTLSIGELATTFRAASEPIVGGAQFSPWVMSARVCSDSTFPRTRVGASRVGAKAMTLIELLVVLAIVGMIVGMSVPAFTGYAKRMRLKTTVREVVGLLSLARSLAITSHQEHKVVIDLERRQISVRNLVSGEALEQVVRLPAAVALEVQSGGEPVQETQLVFRATGSLAGRTVSLILKDRDQQHTISVTGATGAVVVQD